MEETENEYIEEISNSPHDVIWREGDWFECIYCSSKSVDKEMLRRLDCTRGREIKAQNDE